MRSVAGRRSDTDDDVPGLDPVGGDEAVEDVGVAEDEVGGGGFIGEDEEAAVNRFADSAGEPEPPGLVEFAGEGKMGRAVGFAALDDVWDVVVEEDGEHRWGMVTEWVWLR